MIQWCIKISKVLEETDEEHGTIIKARQIMHYWSKMGRLGYIQSRELCSLRYNDDSHSNDLTFIHSYCFKSACGQTHPQSSSAHGRAESKISATMSDTWRCIRQPTVEKLKFDLHAGSDSNRSLTGPYEPSGKNSNRVSLYGLPPLRLSLTASSSGSINGKRKEKQIKIKNQWSPLTIFPYVL